MKKNIYTLIGLLCSLGSFGQVSEFTSEITPSFNNSTIKLEPRLFGGDYSNTKDYLDVLAISSDCTVYDPDTKLFAPMKGNISSVFLFQDGNLGATKQDSFATVFASLDKNQKDLVLGDGGGVIFFKIQRTAAGPWKVVNMAPINQKPIYYKNISFKSPSVSGTIGNKSICYVGTVGNSTQRILVTEDVSTIISNKDLVAGFSDTSDFTFPTADRYPNQLRSPIPVDQKPIRKYQSMGWPVEVDAVSGQVISKFHRLGRGVRALTSSVDSYYFVYGENPSVLMRYSGVGNLSDIQRQDYPPGGDPSVGGGDGSIYLYAYKQNEDGSGDFSIPVATRIDTILIANPDPANPNQIKQAVYTQDFDSLLIAKDIALRGGATMFANIGDIAVSTDEYGQPILLITEKGVDNSGDAYSNPAKKYNGVLAKHLVNLDASDGTADGKFSDPFGRVLVINNLSVLGVGTGGMITSLIEGGASKAGGYFLSNPDKLELILEDPVNSTNVLAIHENIPNADKGRNPTFVDATKQINEAYYATFSGNGQGTFPFDYSDPSNPVVASITLSNDLKLYQSGSYGSLLSTSRGYENSIGGTFITNSKLVNSYTFDTHVSVLNGYNGTDKSMILAVRNGKGIVTGFLADEFFNESKALSVWPNPSKGKLTTNVVSDYTLSDLSGKSLRSFYNTNEMDVSDLEKGIYVLKMTSSSSVTKVVIE
jgi:hypothetical protein